MKTQSVKSNIVKPSKRATIVKGFDPEADVIARSYYADKAKIKSAEDHIVVLKEELNGLLATQGVRDGNTLLVKGNSFAVGVTDVMSSPTLQQDALHAELLRTDPKVCKQVFQEVTSYVLVEDAFMRLVSEGIIPRPLVEKHTTVSSKKGERISITKL